MTSGCKFGTHRVIYPVGSLPQAAKKLDNESPIFDNEIEISVDVLNIDSASFTQLKTTCDNNPIKIAEMIFSIVSERGKMQNPVTGSGGMLIGTIKNIGKNYPDKSLKVGMKIATLVSLTLTPLFIKKINKVNIKNEQVEIEGTAYLFATGIYAVLPDDIPEKLALAALDVAGAPAQVNKLVKEGDIVYILGAGGKSGLLCCYQAKKNVGKTGLVIAVEYREDQKQLLLDNNLADIVLIHDARNAHGLYKKVIDNNLPLGDVVINVVNINNTENASILLTKDEGLVYFFSMATSFTKAALGAEGVGSDIKMLIGNGYTKNHANFTLDIIRESEVIRKIFMEKYV